MRLANADRIVVVVTMIGVIAALLMLVQPVPAAALPDYATKTGQACGVCHVNPAGGGALTPRGTAFAAVANHAADPAGAFAASGAAQPTATSAAPAATPTTAAPAATPTAPPAASPTTAPAVPPTAAPKPTTAATPAATATATPGTLPRTGGFPLAPMALGSASILLAIGWSVRRIFRR